MMKVLLILFGVLGLLAFGCTQGDYSGLPKELVPPAETTLAGQAFYDSISCEELGNGIELSTGLHYVTWPCASVPVEVGVDSVLESAALVYNLNTNPKRYFVPVASRYQPYVASLFEPSPDWTPLEIIGEGERILIYLDGADVLKYGDVPSCSEGTFRVSDDELTVEACTGGIWKSATCEVVGETCTPSCSGSVLYNYTTPGDCSTLQKRDCSSEYGGPIFSDRTCGATPSGDISCVWDCTTGETRDKCYGSSRIQRYTCVDNGYRFDSTLVTCPTGTSCSEGVCS